MAPVIDFADWWTPVLLGSGLTVVAGRAWRRIVAEMEAAGLEAAEADARRRSLHVVHRDGAA